MNSEQLAEATQEFCHKCDVPRELIELASARILGPGDEQYFDGEHHAFELMPMEQLIAMFREEIADVLVYMVMILLRQPFNGWLVPRFVRLGSYLGTLFRVAARVRIV